MNVRELAKVEFAVISRLADGTEAGERAFRAYTAIVAEGKTTDGALRMEILAGLRNAHEHCSKTMYGDHGAMTVMRIEQAIETIEAT